MIYVQKHTLKSHKMVAKKLSLIFLFKKNLLISSPCKSFHEDSWFRLIFPGIRERENDFKVDYESGLKVSSLDKEIIDNNNNMISY